MIPTEDIKMVNFVLKKNLFEFSCLFYLQISGMTAGTKFAPPHASIFMEYIYWNGLVKNTSYKTLAMENIHWYLLYLDRFWGKFKQVPKGS